MLGGEGRRPPPLTPVSVLAHHVEGLDVGRELGADRVLRRGADGSIDVEVPCANLAAFRSWVLGLLDRAEVIGPPDVRAAVIAWLQAMVPS